MKYPGIKISNKIIFALAFLALIILIALFIINPKHIVRALEDTTTTTIPDTSTTTTTTTTTIPDTTTTTISDTTTTTTTTTEPSASTTTTTIPTTTTTTTTIPDTTTTTTIPPTTTTTEPSTTITTTISLPNNPSTSVLKERKFSKTIILDKNARHSCLAKTFTLNVSHIKQTTAFILFTGMRSSDENIEIGSLPFGIDITFSNNNYFYNPSKNDEGIMLDIVNYDNSQKGNFSIPIIYMSGNSTTICQINIINF